MEALVRMCWPLPVIMSKHGTVTVTKVQTPDFHVSVGGARGDKRAILKTNTRSDTLNFSEENIHNAIIYNKLWQTLILQREAVMTITKGRPVLELYVTQNQETITNDCPQTSETFIPTGMWLWWVPAANIKDSVEDVLLWLICSFYNNVLLVHLHCKKTNTNENSVTQDGLTTEMFTSLILENE